MVFTTETSTKQEYHSRIPMTIAGATKLWFYFIAVTVAIKVLTIISTFRKGGIKRD